MAKVAPFHSTKNPGKYILQADFDNSLAGLVDLIRASKTRVASSKARLARPRP